jgi:hypothetical protein
MGFTLNQLEQERQIRKLQKKEDKDTSNYEQLSNLPKINNVELKGDKTTSDLGIHADNVMMSDGVTSVEDAINKIVVNSCTLTYYDANSLRGTATIPAGFTIADAFISTPRYDGYTVKGRLFTFVAEGNLIVLLGSNFVSGDTVTVKVAWIKA